MINPLCIYHQYMDYVMAVQGNMGQYLWQDPEVVTPSQWFWGPQRYRGFLKFLRQYQPAKSHHTFLNDLSGVVKYDAKTQTLHQNKREIPQFFPVAFASSLIP